MLTLLNLGHLAHLEGDEERAARLVAAGQALGAAICVGPAAYEQPEHEQVLRDLRARMGEVAFGAAWAAGHGLSYEQAVDRALAL